MEKFEAGQAAQPLPPYTENRNKKSEKNDGETRGIPSPQFAKKLKKLKITDG